MELYQLRYFHAVAERGGLRAAAEHLVVSQSAVSRAIASLESEIGVPLFTRRGRVNELNRFGVAFRDSTRDVARSIDIGVSTVRELAGAAAGTVSVGFLHSLGATVVPRAIREHRRTHEAVEFELHQNSGRDVITRLAGGVTDLCISVPGLFAEVLDVQWAPLYTEELLVVVPLGHRFAARKRLRFADLADEPFVAMDREHTLRHVFDNACVQAGMSPRITFEGTDIGTLRGLVGGGLGVALLPAAPGPRDDVVEVPLSDAGLVRQIAIGWVPDRYLPPAAVAFRDTVLTMVGKAPAARQ
ncbi:LysR family transcriptional regulator [Williamsia phyllosphaerae]|uniref:LysR family transcriptional regulator n=1 Tax=Williamsia phyllosphaerae TaxID=885042 RepID=A0ABQ1UAT3_9NOCA|nr:LysR family transcriptional regulator [Williamsia phyllosphaerae]GGF12528.1 LysR family transcriptional regulator [Williamsia phyllosphaerae]